jgi:hypothetical protein
MLRKIRGTVKAYLPCKINEYHLAGDESVPLEEKMAVVCLILYYFLDRTKAEQLSFAIFEHYKGRVKHEKIVPLKDNIDKLMANGHPEDITVSIALMDDLRVTAEKRLELADSDIDIVPIATALVKEYFD